MMAYTGRLRPNPREVLNKYLYGEAPPRGPTPYLLRKRSTFVTDSYFMTVRVSSSLKGYKVLSKVCERRTICQ